MCGIGGFQGEFDPSLLDRMNDLMAHRGPDGKGVFFHRKSGTGLAHRRLAIIDLSSHGSQPMWDVTGTVAISFNGEIYNFQALRDELVGSGFTFRSSTDTEVILNLYLKYGTDMLQKLNGMFAFAVFDTRDDSLFVARDGFGVKPLYYSELSKGVIFASELKAILLEQSVSREISARAVQSYVRYMWAPAPLTPLKKVHKLEPGWAFKIRQNRIVSKWQFYELPYGNEDNHMSAKDAADRVYDALETAVRRQLVSDVPLGAFLSGGLDSSGIATAIRRSPSTGDIAHFTVRVEGHEKEGFSEDLDYAVLVARHLGIDLRVLNGAEALPTDLSEMIYHLDEPQADPAAIHVRHIAEAARNAGVKVLFSGAGGDDFFSGYRRHYALCLEKYWDWLPAKLKLLLRKGSNFVPVWLPALRRFRKAFHYADLNGDARIASYFRWIEPEAELGLYSREVTSGQEQIEAHEPLLDSLSKLPAGTDPLTKMLWLDAKHFLTDHNLNYTDKMSMSRGVEVRVPYLDPDLVFLASRLPTRYKQNGRSGKWILRKALEPYLPKQVVYREKTGFGITARAWFRNGIPDICSELLSPSCLRDHGLFDPVAVNRLVKLNQMGIIDAAYPILAIVCIQLWLKTFVDVPIPKVFS